MIEEALRNGLAEVWGGTSIKGKEATMTDQTIGAWIEGALCNFRVWAPNAENVKVLLQAGDCWDRQMRIREEPLIRDDIGYWKGAVANVPPGTLYRYAVIYDGITREKLDPAARDVIHSGLTRFDPDNCNASIILDPGSTDWVPFETPAFENFIIYQLHVGSFAGRNDHLNDKAIGGFLDVATKFSYIRDLGFNAIELLPIHEFAADRSWGYNPASFFAPESAYGRPKDLREFVNRAHAEGLAVIFDVVYNHAGPGDNVLWRFDGFDQLGQGGIYFEGGQMTPWGRGPAWWKQEVQNYFFENASMFLENYRGDGLRFDVTTQINGNHLAKVVGRLKRHYPEKYFIAEHLPADPWITIFGNFDATWHAGAHHECQRALNGADPIGKVKSFLGWEGFDNAWNLIKYTLGSHDDCGDQESGDAEHGLSNWDASHRYFVDQFGGRNNWHARSKCRLAWALNIAMPGTPMLFMGTECHMGAPSAVWGYWHDGPDLRGDHRFDWGIAGDSFGMEMRRLVRAANHVRWNHSALRSNTLSITHEDEDNGVLAFKRWDGNHVVLAVINMGDRSFSRHDYGVHTGGQKGRWRQILCTQDAEFGGWDGAGNAFYDPWTQSDGRIYINLPKWSVVMLRLG